MSDLPNQQERIAGMARNVVAGHRGAFGQPCSECGQLSPCHAWTLANEILHPLHSNPTSSVSTEGVADLDVKRDIAESICYVERHEHTATEPTCEASRGVATRTSAAIQVRQSYRFTAINPDSPVEPDRG